MKEAGKRKRKAKQKPIAGPCPNPSPEWTEMERQDAVIWLTMNFQDSLAGRTFVRADRAIELAERIRLVLNAPAPSLQMFREEIFAGWAQPLARKRTRKTCAKSARASKRKL